MFMKKYCLPVFLIILSASIALACTAPQQDGLGEAQLPTPAMEAMLAPDFRLPQLAGGDLALADFRGEWLLLNFWATWCTPCRDEMPYLDALARDERSGLTVLGINMREDPVEVQAFVDEMAISFPILLYPDDETILTYDIRGLPISVIIAPDGTVARRILGPLAPGEFNEWFAAASDAVQ